MNRYYLLTENPRLEEIITELRRRYAIIKDQLIGQSPEDLERHYRLIGQRDAYKGMLKFINADKDL